MEMLLGSRTKANVLKYLGLRGGRSGRALAKALKMSPTPVFKALRSLCKANILRRSGPPYYYSLNPNSLFYEEILQMITKDAQQNPPPYLPKISGTHRVDPVAIYRLLDERGPVGDVPKLSEILREKYD